jgi:hypothetical protein
MQAVLNPEEVKTAVDLTWDYLAELGTGVDRNDPKTWGDDRWPTTVHGDILPGHGIGQCGAQWYIRSRKPIHKTFAKIWNDEDLLTSFDGMALWRPWALNDEWRTQSTGSWLHIDQHPIARPGLQCVQALVTLLPTSKGTGGNVLIPGTHKDFKTIPERYPKRIANLPSNVDHFRFPNDDPLLASDDKVPIMCHMEAGDMLLWDSRTIHCAAPSLDDGASREMQLQNPGLLRAVSLVCMMPRKRSSEAVIQERKQCVEGMRTTTNWTDILTTDKVFTPIQDALAKNPNKFKVPPQPVLNDYQLKLVGYEAGEYRHGTARL